MKTIIPLDWHADINRNGAGLCLSPDWQNANSRGEICYKFRCQSVSRLPHRIRALLCHEWLYPLLPQVERALVGELRPQQSLRNLWRWIQKPSKRNEKTGFIFARRSWLGMHYGSDHHLSPELETALYIAQGGQVVRESGRSSSSVSILGGTVTGVANATGFPYDSDAPERHEKEAWCWRTFQAAKGPDMPFDSAWRTSDAVAIAKQIHSSRDLSAMPILADALEEAGMNLAGVLSHLREDSQDWTLADWALTNLLGIFAPEAELPDWFDEENQSSKE